jgi:putative heme-binding domain-containing protein
MICRTSALLLILGMPLNLVAQSTAKIVDPDPEIERQTFILPEGFEVNLFAADPLLAKPIQMNFDPQGRLWVACSEVYPHIKPGEKANDKILVLEDTKGTGRADKVTVFADGLLIPTGVEPGDGGAYVGNSTELLHLSASKPGGKADRTRVVLSGFGTEDTHHIVHTLRWGPDGMLYFNQSVYIHSHIETPYGVRNLNGGGIWQFRPETMQLEVFVRGFWNAWGHHFDRFGQSFITDGANGEGVTHGVPGAGYPASVGMLRVLHGLNPGSPKHCGLEVLGGTHLPEDWRGNVLTNDFRGHRVCRFVLKDDGSTFASQEKAELIKSNHPAFRPIDVKMGPDGAIYIADWYNPIIQHGEIDFRDPRRDHTHGRIWRITAKNRPLVKKVDLVGAKLPELLNYLKSNEDWVRQQAKRVLKERGAKEVLPALDSWVIGLDAGSPEREHHLLEALWVYQSLDVVEPKLLSTLLEAKDFHIRAAATRVLSQWQARLLNARKLLTARVADANPRVRMEAVRALATLHTARAAEIAMTALDLPVDRTLDYALWLTAKDLEPYWMPALQEGKLDFGGSAKRLTFALEAVVSTASIGAIVKLLERSLSPETERSLWLLLTRVGGPDELGRVLERAAREMRGSEVRKALSEAVAEQVRLRKIGPPRNVAELLPAHLGPDGPADTAIVKLAGLWKIEAVRGTLEKYAGNAKLAEADHQAAFEALAALGGPKSKKAFEQLASASDERTRRAAIAALVVVDLSVGVKRAVELFAAAKPGDDLLALYTAILNRKGGATALAKALDGKKLAPDMAKLGMRALRASVQDAPDLLTALTLAGNLAAQKHDLTKKELDELVGEVLKTGNAARGEALYRRADLQCLKCHAIGGAGGLVGPDLASIGASAPVDYLIESLLVPNKAVKEGFHAVRIVTLDGRVFTGIKVRETRAELAIRTAEDQEIIIPVKNIDEKRDSRSLMPDGLVDTLTRGELVDLVRFLSELGKLGPYSLSKARVVRRWQALQPTNDGMNLIRRSRIAAVAENDPAFVWLPSYSLVSGDLPLDAAPTITVWKDTPPLGVLRFQLDVTTAGKVKLHFNSASGVSLMIGANPVDTAEETIVDLPAGVQTLLISVDRSKHTGPLRLELEDVVDSPARVAVVGGK